MTSRGPKRNVPPALRKLLQVDEQATEKFYVAVNKFLPLRALKIHYKMLEISCHGILWIAGWILFIWLSNTPSLYQMQANFLLGLILDCVFVAVIKAFVRRRRPAGNEPDMAFTFGPDVYGFPSGHASRATFIVHFFMVLHPIPVLFFPSLLAWSTSICLSRVLLRRHHLLDVAAGILLGVLEGFLIGLLWLSQSSSDYFLSWLSGDKMDGSEVEVEL